MAAKLRRADEALPLSPPVLYILLALSDGDRHGYAIMQEVDERTGGKVRLLPGSLYSTIKRMLAQRLIEERPQPAGVDSDDERRRYYGITPLGRQITAAEVDRLRSLIAFAREKKVVPKTAG
jgi:DNA-binding PadR family transcriptional regulator